MASNAALRAHRETIERLLRELAASRAHIDRLTNEVKRRVEQIEFLADQLLEETNNAE